MQGYTWTWAGSGPSNNRVQGHNLSRTLSIPSAQWEPGIIGTPTGLYTSSSWLQRQPPSGEKQTVKPHPHSPQSPKVLPPAPAFTPVHPGPGRASPCRPYFSGGSSAAHENKTCRSPGQSNHHKQQQNKKHIGRAQGEIGFPLHSVSPPHSSGYSAVRAHYKKVSIVLVGTVAHTNQSTQCHTSVQPHRASVPARTACAMKLPGRQPSGAWDGPKITDSVSK